MSLGRDVLIWRKRKMIDKEKLLNFIKESIEMNEYDLKKEIDIFYTRFHEGQISIAESFLKLLKTGYFNIKEPKND